MQHLRYGIQFLGLGNAAQQPMGAERLKRLGGVLGRLGLVGREPLDGLQ
jgi:hypothetical protein